ncbi:hypothetical protein C8F04DRAFT_1308231 [Mycena alexandri]|uniref:Uncharacterized protein n=1 Tax=Mycena alexandri TaxID=1745969 RepID=A0AAD6TJP3_9AGAR|nr:hypothetical protein C8F04DRAFT_1308231 [Mycena alexandri]
MLRAKSSVHRLRLVPSGSRVASRNASTEATPGAVPGIPPAAQSTKKPTTYMSFNMPDIALRPSQPQPQIPYLPDFWESSAKNAPQVPAEPVLPKISVVSELNTTHSHNLYIENAATASEPSPDPVSVGPRSFGKGGLFSDMSEDMGLPSPKEIKAGVSNFLRSFR